MKKSVLPLLTVLAAFWIVFTSNESGPGFQQGVDYTGSPLGGSFCGDCHSSGRYNTTLQVQLLDGTTPVTSYAPGKTYTIEVKVVTGSGSPAGFGYQTTVLVAGSNAKAGTMGAVPSGQRLITLGGRQYSEHTRLSTSNTFKIPWTAPAIGTGTVNVYAAGVAANGSGSSGDGANKTSLSLTEATSSDLAEAKILPANIEVYPNPVIDRATIEVKGELEQQKLWVELLDVHGRKLQVQKLEHAGQASQIQLDVETLPRGMYWIRVSDGKRIKTVSLVK